MIERRIHLPTNRHIRPQPDSQWPVTFGMLALVPLLLAATLALIGWPRLRDVSLHYDLVRLRTVVESLRHQERQLEAELEMLRSPEVLARQAREMGLAPPTASAISASTEDRQ